MIRRSNKTLHAFTFVVIFISLMLIGYSSWLILAQNSVRQPTHTIKEDTNPCFTDGVSNGTVYFTATEQKPTLSEIGVSVYSPNGETYTDVTDDANATSGYRLIWNGVLLGGNISKELAYKNVLAGTHYYTIVDVATGQIISNNHAFVITPDVVTATATAVPLGFEGREVTWEVTLTGTYSGLSTTITHTLVVPRDSYQYDTTTKAFTTSKNLQNESVIGNKSTDDGSYNNYDAEKTSAETAKKINPTNFNFTAARYSLSYEVLPTCYNGSGTTVTAYYGNLYQAVKNSTSGTIYAMHSVTHGDVIYKAEAGTDGNYDHVIDRNCELNANVTLYIPHRPSSGVTDYSTAWPTGTVDDTTYPFPTTTTLSGAPSAYNSAKQTNLVTVKSGSTFTAKGVIHISGEVSGAQNNLYGSGLTNGNHSQITIESGANVVAENKVYCYGFISGEDSTSTIEMKSGDITLPYTVIEHRGGTSFLGMIGGITAAMFKNPQLETAAFNRFYICGVTANLVVQSGASVTGYADLHAGSDHNYTMIKLVGASGNHLVQLARGSRIECTFNPSVVVNDSGTSTYGQNELHIYGSATINSLKLTVTALNQSIELSTEKVHFPLSHYWKVHLHKGSDGTATVTSAKQSIKMWPKSELTVGEGVTLTLPSLTVYNPSVISQSGASTYNDDFTEYYDPTKGDPGGYRSVDVHGDAILNVAGTLKLTTSFGGLARPISTTAKLITPATMSVTHKELQLLTNPTDDATKLSQGAYCSYYTFTTSASYDKYDGNTVTFGGLEANKEYSGYAYTKNGSTAYAWGFRTDVKITYVSNGGPTISDKIACYWSDGSVTIDGNLYPEPVRSYYTFGGWYTDSALTNSASGKVIKNDITLYAKWTANPYTLEFRYVYDDNFGDIVPNIPLPEQRKFYVTDSSVPLPTVTSDYSFLGWFSSADCINASKIAATSCYELLNQLNPVDGKCVVYGLWSNTKYWTVTYSSSGSNNGWTTSSLDGTSIGNQLPDSTLAGNRFDGWYTAQNGGGTKVDKSYVPSEDITVYAYFVPYTVTYNANGGTDQAQGSGVVTLPTPTRTNYRFTGWYTAASGGTKVGDAGATYTPTADVTLYAHWIQLYKVTYNANSGSVSPSSETVDAGDSVTLPTPTRNNYTFNGWYTASSGGTKVGDAGATYTPSANVTLYAQWTNNGCIVEGTMITLADGTKKPVEELTMSDTVLIFNHHTGKMEEGHIAMLDHLNDESDLTNVVNLEFSNGEVLRIVWNHGLFDATLNEYVFINEQNMLDYVGHQFYSSEYMDGGFVGKLVTLTDAYVTEEFIKVYNPTTVWHMNYFASGILNVTAAPYVVSGHMNYFELDASMKYDEEKMRADIEKYGLYTYDDFSDLLTYEQYCALPFEYLKVSVGKGMITWDGIVSIIDYLKTGGILPQ